jgi:hypothetical protein
MPPDISLQEHAKDETCLEGLLELLEFGKLSITSRFLSLMHLILCESAVLGNDVWCVLLSARANKSIIK